MEQNGFDPLRHSVLLLATFPHGQVPEVRGLQCPAGGHLRRADALPTQGTECKIKA